MPARSETELIQFHDWTIRVRRADSRNAPLLLLIHGWTGDENSMWVFTRGLPADYWILAPRAPYAAKPSGYSWRAPLLERDNALELEDLRSAAEGLIELVDAYRGAQGLASGSIDLMGFSQGAALAAALALLFPDRVGRIGVLAGFVPKGAGLLTSRRPLEGKHIFVAHGSMDEMVDIAHAHHSVKLLEESGATVTLCEDEVGHKVSAGCLRGLQAFFA